MTTKDLQSIIVALENDIKNYAAKDHIKLRHVVKAFNAYKEETTCQGYIYSLNCEDDLIALIKFGASAQTISILYNKGCEYITVHKESNCFRSNSKEDVRKIINIEVNAFAQAILANPFNEAYKPLYLQFISEALNYDD